MRFRSGLAALASLAAAGTISLIPTVTASAAPAREVPAREVPARDVPARDVPARDVPASAASRCPADHVCFYSGANYTGKMEVHKNPRKHECGVASLRPARSVYNRDDQTWGFYADLKCTDHARTLAPGTGITYTEAFSWA
jgi:hypothetical protein